MSMKYLIILSRISVNARECYLRNICSATSLKVNFRTNSKMKDREYKISINDAKESDEFGNLKFSLEKDFKSKRNSASKSAIHERKKVIKLKKPETGESDVFGNLSEKNPLWYPEFNEELKKDNDLSDDSILVKNLGKRYQCPRKYLSEMKRLVKEKKVKDALNLFVEMRRNLVTPLLPHYTLMIGVCGRIGYTEMAFKLLRQLTDRSYTPTPATLTGLFNACAESPFPEYGLKKAHSLKEKIEIKNWTLHKLTYHAMIKAFGKCGDLMTAFKIVDEMTKADIKIDVETYSFLLMSCISNKEAGFTYAVEVWRKMKEKKCKPNVFTCNLLLRAARDCDVGPEEISCLLLQHWSSYSKRPYGFITKERLSKEPILKLQSGLDSVVSEPSECVNDEMLNESFHNKEIPSHELQEVVNKNVMTSNSETLATSLLLSRPINGPEILEVVNIKSAGDRLSLIGGMEGFLKSMQESKIVPDIKTFCLILECLPDNIKEEEKLLSVLDTYKMKPNIVFFNILIKKRNFRKETDAARAVLFLINKYELTPDIMTYGALVFGCKTLQQATTFIHDMKKFGSSPNIEIVGSLAKSACIILDFPYMKYTLELMEKEDIKPDVKLLSTFEKTLSKARKNIILMEQGRKVDDFYQKKQNLPANLKEFFQFYEEWLKRMKFEGEEHPWQQYKTDIIDKAKIENFNDSHSC